MRYAVVASRGVWRSLVARFVRDEEVVGSNPATPTHSNQPASQGRLILFDCTMATQMKVPTPEDGFG